MWRGDFFPKNTFLWGTNFEGKVSRGIVLHGGGGGGLMIRSYQGEGVSQNAFSSNLNNVNLKDFLNIVGIFT